MSARDCKHIPAHGRTEEGGYDRPVEEKPKYGLPFELESYEEIIAPGKDAIVNYLSSGLIQGVGKRLAERIYNTF